MKFSDLDHVLCCLDLVTRYVFHVSCRRVGQKVSFLHSISIALPPSLQRPCAVLIALQHQIIRPLCTLPPCWHSWIWEDAISEQAPQALYPLTNARRILILHLLKGSTRGLSLSREACVCEVSFDVP